MDATVSDLALVVVLALGWRAAAADRRRFVSLVFSSLLATLVIQLVVQRPRPFGAPLVLLDMPFWSFPSGHACALAACAVYIAHRRPRWGVAAVALAVVGAGLRVTADLHYLSDAGAGLALGAGLGVFGARAGRDDRPAWAWALFPWLGLMLNLSIFATIPLGSVQRLLFAGADKPLHFILFGMLGFFVAAWSRRPRRALAALAVLTVLEELSQGLQANRTLDLWDGVMSLAGLLSLGALGTRLAGLAARSRRLRSDGEGRASGLIFARPKLKNARPWPSSAPPTSEASSGNT